MNQSDNWRKFKSVAWGFIIFVPLGFLFFWNSLLEKHKKIEKGTISAEKALESLFWNVVGFFVAVPIVVALLFSMPGGITPRVAIVLPLQIALVLLCYFTGKRRIKKRYPIEKDYDPENIISLAEYNKEVSKIKTRLEAADLSNYNEKTKFKVEINKLISKYKDYDFPEGGKYKIYKLKAEYFYLTGQKILAEKYIKRAAQIQSSEKARAKTQQSKKIAGKDNNRNKEQASYEDELI